MLIRSYNAWMKRNVAILALIVCPALAQADNFATCLLDELPGVQNNNSAGAAFQVCSGRYPAGYGDIEQGSGRSLLGYDSGAECALDKGRDTRSQDAAGMIRVACNRLYNAPPPAESTDQGSCSGATPGPWCSYR
ncbi:hypothetical protein [Pseudomonas sp. SO81]|uniref:hypothetical protein n=1 Tax=Pseudomonas sp. SO81 TaxID=2983246 RepID=UPI0025A3E553|nr:hypothetical protein [Pseudomonas sp. SO81]WJN61375.1 hypothetical protein OH686_21740 [Pseudomonas sp. SO81]